MTTLYYTVLLGDNRSSNSTVFSHYLKTVGALVVFHFLSIRLPTSTRVYIHATRWPTLLKKFNEHTYVINLFVHDLMLEQFHHRLVLRTSHKHTRERGVLKRARSFAQSIVLLIPRQLLDFWIFGLLKHKHANCLPSQVRFWMVVW